ncbi:MAG: ribosomal protein L30p/L7e-domain-containing protein [Monoraphidium minutum]|nr:MAG: ribosomal protein L30p/L7e-domain-containing protein [Monoraphidium minutum]
MSAAQQAVRSFFVTLRRSPIGTPWNHKRILASLGLKTRHDCVERANTDIVRGQLQKVAHLVRIETDTMFLKRKIAEAEAASLKPPIRVQHAAAGGAAAGLGQAQLGGGGGSRSFSTSSGGGGGGGSHSGGLHGSGGASSGSGAL